MFGKNKIKKVIPVEPKKKMNIPIIKSEEDLYESQNKEDEEDLDSEEEEEDEEALNQQEEEIDEEEEILNQKIKLLEERQRKLKNRQEERKEIKKPVENPGLTDEVVRNTFYNLDLRMRAIEDWIIRIKNL